MRSSPFSGSDTCDPPGGLASASFTAGRAKQHANAYATINLVGLLYRGMFILPAHLGEAHEATKTRLMLAVESKDASYILVLLN